MSVSTLVLLSGGLDSIAAARLALTEGRLVACVTFDYGQPAALEETITSARWCAVNGVAHHVRRLDLDAGALAEGGPDSLRVVPGRNAALLSAAVNLAVLLDCRTVTLGAIADDRDSYPDCRQPFLGDLGGALLHGYGVGVEAPLLALTKRQAAALLTIDDREASFSCYVPAGQFRHCGRCRSCLERSAALGG